MSTTAVSPAKAASPNDALKKLLSNVFTLYYRKGNNPHPMVKNFYSNGKDLQEHVRIAKQHCESTNLRFIRLEKFISDLREDERVYSGREAESDEITA